VQWPHSQQFACLGSFCLDYKNLTLLYQQFAPLAFLAFWQWQVFRAMLQL
jgi:hypothetical protein